MKGLHIAILIIFVEWVIFLLLNILIFKISSTPMIPENRFIDQLIKLINNIIIGGIWLYTWNLLGQKLYYKLKSSIKK